MAEEVSVEVVKFSNNVLELKVRGEGHTLLNLLVDELNRDPRVTAAYRVEHPLLNIAYFIVKTDGTVNPLDALKEARERLKAKLEAFRKQVLEQVSQS